MPNMENFFLYEDYQYQLVAHILVFGFGAMVAGFVYFAITASTLSPKYRTANYLGCVVMVSAALILFTQYTSWTETFQFGRVGSSAAWFHPALGIDSDGQSLLPPSDENMFDKTVVAERLQRGRFAAGQTTGSVFSNGYRYMNWTIDVPTLQIQLLAILGVSGAAFFRSAVKFTIGGLAMIYASYVAQFYEPAFAPDAEWASGQMMFWVFYGIGWLAYMYILYAVYTDVFRQTSHMHPRSQKLMTGIWRLFLITWTVYAIAIAMPAIAYNAHGVVWRQYLFTFSDVISKVIFGAMISRVALYQSAAEGYEPAIESCQWDRDDAAVLGGESNPTSQQLVSGRSPQEGVANADHDSSHPERRTTALPR